MYFTLSQCHTVPPQHSPSGEPHEQPFLNSFFLARSVLLLSLLSVFEVCTKMFSHELNLLSSLLFQMVTRTKKIFVGGLSANTVVEDVKQYFEQFGKVRSRVFADWETFRWLKTLCP